VPVRPVTKENRIHNRRRSRLEDRAERNYKRELILEERLKFDAILGEAIIIGRSHHFLRALCSLLHTRRAIAAGAWSGIAKTELTLISHKTYLSSPDAVRGP
jgi:hypothetical protein